MHTLSIFFAYFVQFIKTRAEYKTDFIISLIANTIAACSGLLYVFFLINGESVTSIQGWKREEIFFIFGIANMGLALFMLIAINLYNFADKYIIQGQFDRILLRPVNSLAQILFESFNLESFGTFLLGLGLVIYSSTELSISFSFLDVLWMIISVLSSSVILLAVFVIVSSLSFHFEDRLGISAPIFNLINFGRYPITIYNKILQFLLCWVIPFAFIAFFPATYFLKKEEFYFYCALTPLVAIVFSFIARFFWRLGVSRYTSVGN